MSENPQTTPTPNHDDQVVKTDILGMIHNAENPFDILYHIAVYLEKKSQEPGYAKTVLENIRTVYGVVLGEQKLLTDELRDVEARLARIEEACKSSELSEEEAAREALQEECDKARAAHLEKQRAAGELEAQLAQKRFREISAEVFSYFADEDYAGKFFPYYPEISTAEEERFETVGQNLEG